MKKIKKVLVVLIILIIAILGKTVVSQSSNETIFKKLEYTEEYKNWLELSEEDKQNQIQPRKYEIQTQKTNIINDTNNIFRMGKMLKTSTNSIYTLKNIISDNMNVKNQETTNACWAFSILGSLETNLAMLDIKNSNPLNIYNFSERHMVYSSSRTAFLNEQINEKGFNIMPQDGGNHYIGLAYLTNGSGAINEEQLPFENNENNIDISTILNKDVTTTLYDTIEIEKPLSSEKQETIEKMKTHISNYGGLYAGIHGNNIMSSEYYNNETGAIYCTNSFMAPIDHMILIVGWDDNYSKDNFNEKNQPENNGAWIIRNSWGEKDTIEIEEFKEELFAVNESYFTSQGINSASEIPDEFAIQLLEENGYTKETDNTYSLKIGDNGYMYVSYDDVNIYSEVYGIQKAKAEKDYLNLYQNDILGASNALYLYNSRVNKYYLANVFKRETTENESLDRISVYTLKDYNNCKVYVNPNGNSKIKEDLQEVPLKIGDTIDIAPGYHTIEFENPIELTGDSFVVVLEIEADGYFYFTMESKIEGMYEYAEVNANESFVTTDLDLENNQWMDTGILTKADFNDTNADTTDEDYQGNINIKAYTVATEESNPPITKELTRLEITEEPDKLIYTVGEDFNTTGMEVTAVYNDGERKIVTDYTVVNGLELEENQETVIISYTENKITKTVEQAITVNPVENDNEEDKNDQDNENNGENEGNQDNENNEDNEEIKKQPTASDFKEAKATVIEANIYVDNETSEVNMTIKVSNIKIGDEENKYTYYYCLSGNADGENIKDGYWIEVPSDKLKKESDGTYSITLYIDQNELKNLEEIENSENLYLFIKEIAEIDGNKLETVNNLKITLDIEPEIDNGDNNQTQTEQDKDETLSDKIIPNAGKISIILVIIGIMVFGSLAYFRYKNIDR